MGGRASAASKNKWSAKVYDRVNLTIPKGKKEVIQDYASARGESVNGMINRLLRAELGQSLEEWEQRTQEPEQ